MASMRHTISNIATYKQAISWLLVLSFLSLTLFPCHFHLHHGEEPTPASITAYNHFVDLHGVLDLTDSDHHQDSHTIEPATDLTLKSLSVQLPLAFLVLSLLVLLPYTRAERLNIATINDKLPHFRWHTTPPLRAPPIN